MCGKQDRQAYHSVTHRPGAAAVGRKGKAQKVAGKKENLIEKSSIGEQPMLGRVYN